MLQKVKGVYTLQLIHLKMETSPKTHVKFFSEVNLCNSILLV